jgi:hypothetical protein
MRRYRSAIQISHSLLLIAVILLQGCAGINTDSLEELWGTNGNQLDTETVIAGLKEALHVGTDRTVASTSSPDGFWGNALIRIVIPGELQDMAGTLRKVGLGGEVDRFELAMNRSAEKAAAEATDIFWSAVKNMTIADAWGILNGSDTAATHYFRLQTTASLRERFLPIVQTKMTNVGLYQLYNELVQYYSALPLVSEPTLELDAYITDRALSGLFTVLASEEQRIRADPLARTTDLLRRVFGERS